MTTTTHRGHAITQIAGEYWTSVGPHTLGWERIEDARSAIDFALDEGFEHRGVLVVDLEDQDGDNRVLYAFRIGDHTYSVGNEDAEEARRAARVLIDGLLAG